MADTNRTVPIKRKRRRKLRVGRLIGTILFVVVCVTIIACVTVFFKVNSVTVEGKTRYSDSRIISASGIAVGDSLLLTGNKAENSIITNLPYIGKVTISKTLPDRIILKVSECKANCAFAVDGGYLLANDDKVLEKTDKLPDGITLITAEIKSYNPGEKIQLTNKSEKIIGQILDAAENAKIKNITAVNVNNTSDISICYANRMILKLGTIESLQKKMANGAAIINTEEKKYGNDVEGYINLQYLGSGSNDSYFTRRSISSDSDVSQPDNVQSQAQDSAPQEDPSVVDSQSSSSSTGQ